MKNLWGYLLMIFILGSILAFCISVLLNVLPYVAVGIVCLLPVYGVIRREKQWTSEYFGVGKWVKALRAVFKFGKPSLTFYLVMGIAMGFVYKELAMMLAVTLCYAVGGLAVTALVWEGTRVVVRKWKQIEMGSCFTAIKSSW